MHRDAGWQEEGYGFTGVSGTELRQSGGRRTGEAGLSWQEAVAGLQRWVHACRAGGIESASAWACRRGSMKGGTSSRCCSLAWQASYAADLDEEGRCSGGRGGAWRRMMLEAHMRSVEAFIWWRQQGRCQNAWNLSFRSPDCCLELYSKTILRGTQLSCCRAKGRELLICTVLHIAWVPLQSRVK